MQKMWPPRARPGPSVTSTASLRAPPWIPRGSSRFGELLKSLLKARDLKVEGLVVLCTACRGVTPPQPPPTERGAAGLPGPTLKPLLCIICRRRRRRRPRRRQGGSERCTWYCCSRTSVQTLTAVFSRKICCHMSHENQASLVHFRELFQIFGQNFGTRL